MSDPRDPRPRPAYGEYATPEEQRARIRQPDATWALDGGHTPAPGGVVDGGQPASGSAAAPGPFGSPVAPSAPPPRRPRRADRLATLVLLGYGAVQVLFTALSFADLPATAAATMEMMGIPGEFTNVEQARTWGMVAMVVLVLGYVITFGISVRRLRTGRLTWWVPLVGAVIVYAVVNVLIAVVLLGDPAFMDYIRGVGGG